jgi:hypothetical protein
MRLVASTLSLVVPVLVTALCGALAGCHKSGDDADDGSATVGAAPLRRLSNNEYLNALHDLFPAQHPTLPELPADIPVADFDNAAQGQQPSDVRIARYEAIATLYAEGATVDTPAVHALVGCDDWSTPMLAASCGTQFVDGMGGRLFRRPLTDAEHGRFLSNFQTWQTAVDFEGAVQLTLSAMLQSPQFLYRIETRPTGQAPGNTVAVEPYAMASRLSFFLWESVPDQALLDAASRNELSSADQLRDQATRMLQDDRARRLLWSFHRQWLGLDRILLDENSVKTPAVDAKWTTATPAIALMESQLFVENTLAQGGSFRDLLTSRRAWVNGEMARIYGIPLTGDAAAWTETSLPEAERSGLLTRTGFLAGFAHRGATSPPVRGNAIQLRLLCQLPLSPPPGVDLSQPMATPAEGPQTNRMLFEARTRPAMCQACHSSLNGFGFGFENYNAAAHFQTTEVGLPIDAKGTIHGTDVDGPFDGAIGLSDALSRSEVVHHCATEQLFRYALGRAPEDIEAPTITALAKKFMDSGGDERALMMSIVTAPSFRLRRVEEN